MGRGCAAKRKGNGKILACTAPHEAFWRAPFSLAIRAPQRRHPQIPNDPMLPRQLKTRLESHECA
jgi:hypothetical protein